MLNNAGRPVRAQHVENEEALNKLLQEHSWDLMIGLDTTQSASPIKAIKAIRRLNKDVPVILQTDTVGSQAIVEGMKIGATDVVLMDDDQHLLQVIQRELHNRDERERRRIAERRFVEISRRNQQLLDSSRDAIAFVQDGMFLYSNESFAELMEYDSIDDLDCMPVIDIIHEKDHANIKTFLKDFLLKHDEDSSSELNVTALQQNGEEKILAIDVRKANYDDEPCIQFLVRTKENESNEELEARIEEIKNQDVATGLFNKNYLMEQLEKAVDLAVNEGTNSAILHIGIENFRETVQGKLGVASSDIALGNIANFTKSTLRKSDILCRFSETSFIVLAPSIDASKALELANNIGKQLRNYVVTVDSSTLMFNYHIGVAVVSEMTNSSDVPIQHAQEALDLAKTDAEKDASVIARLYEPEVAPESNTKKDITRRIQDALDDGKFKLLFQPILSLRGSNKEHYEVLLRMLDQSGEQISPNDFLAEAAKIGATTKIDRWVILESIKLLSAHRAQGHNTRLLINLSRESMLDATLAPWLKIAFSAAKLPTDAVIFQLNEVDINDHLNIATSFTQDLAKLGCDTSVTHFGCSLNPFNALKNIHVNFVKIDGSFTEDLQKSAEGADSLNKLVSELHQLDKITVVPFVENASVLSKLWQSGVHYIQGFYLQEPTDRMNYDFDMES